MNCWYLENVNIIACIAMFFDTNSMNVIRFVVEALLGKTPDENYVHLSFRTYG